jgi:ABC-2 type transport system permease protein
MLCTPGAMLQPRFRQLDMHGRMAVQGGSHHARETLMIWTIIQTSFRRLRNNRSELVLSFVVPILFFSIFAVIFGSRGSSVSGTPKIKIAIADSSDSPIARRALELLAEQSSLRILDRNATHAPHEASDTDRVAVATVDRNSAEDMVRRGLVSAAIAFSPPAPSPAPAQSLHVTSIADGSQRMPQIEVMSDSFDQVASQVITAVVQRAVMMAAAEQHQKYFAEQPDSTSLASRLTPDETSLDTAAASDRKSTPALPVSHAMHALRSTAIRNAPSRKAELLDPREPIAAPGGPETLAALQTPGDGELLPPGYPSATPSRIAAVPSFPEPPAIATIDVLGGRKANPVIAMYAAGIAVMFLLFSATTASGSLLEERENSTLDRLLCSRLTMDQLLMGKWAYLTIIGMIQMLLMFSWGSLVFGIEVLRHWEGFIAMTLVTSGAAASFALFLASMCKTRTQLGWVSTIVILTMSALGGSMVPRYLMSETIQNVGLITFNAWALEGFNKIFWRELQLQDIERELAVLTLCAFIFIVSARMFATRWERS